MHIVDTAAVSVSPLNRSTAVTTKESVAISARGARTPIGTEKGFEPKDDSQGKSRTSNSIMTTLSSMALKVQRACQAWSGNVEFLKAQGQVILVLIIAYIGNNWPYSYPRNDNHNYFMFWLMNFALLVAALCTMEHIPNTRNSLQILSRSQTEEWKGWMQWAFIMVRLVHVTGVSFMNVTLTLFYGLFTMLRLSFFLFLVSLLSRLQCLQYHSRLCQFVRLDDRLWKFPLL